MEKRRQLVLGLLDEHGRSLHRMLGRVTRCEHAAGDLLQDLFIRLVSSSAIEKADNPHGYIWRAAANLAFDWRRKRKITAVPLEDAGEVADVYAGPAEKAQQNEQLETMLDSLCCLGELDRNVVYLHYIEQLTYDQIAARLGKNADHLRAVSAKAIAKLRIKLNPTEKEGR